jgi:hypothetical protein
MSEKATVNSQPAIYWGSQIGTGINRCSRYSIGTVGANYQNNPNNHKQDNNNTKEDNPAHKLDPKKLKTEPTNAYNQPTTMKLKMLSRDKSSSTSTQESTQKKTREIKWFGRVYSTGRQTTNKFTINQGYYKRLQKCFNY